jgi:hypothetical protein
MSHANELQKLGADTTVEKVREILEAAIVLRNEAAEARDRTEDLNQASYWSGRANALTELITRLRSAGL